jgi:hypothetical protein
VYEACTVLQEKSCLKSKEASSVFQSFFLPAKFSHTIPFCSPQASADLGLAQVACDRRLPEADAEKTHGRVLVANSASFPG